MPKHPTIYLAVLGLSLLPLAALGNGLRLPSQDAFATAPEAAGEIHTDFQKHFIKAEVVAFDDLMAAGTMAGVRAAGRARIEGKEYVMRDGDVVEFRVNA